MDREADLIDNETFDFADGMLTDDDKENSYDEDEVFFGRVTFKERCKERWVNDHCAGNFDALAEDLRVEDWCEIFTNANLVASTLMADLRKDKKCAIDSSARCETQSSGPGQLCEPHIDGDGPSDDEMRSLSPPVLERRSTFTLNETSLLNTPHEDCVPVVPDRTSGVSEASSYHTAQSTLSSPTSVIASEDCSPNTSFTDLKTPISREIKFDLVVTPPTVKTKTRRSFLPTPNQGSPPRAQETKGRRSVSCENIRDKKPSTDILAVEPSEIQLRPALSDANVASSNSALSRLRPPTTMLREIKATRPQLAAPPKNSNKPHPPSRLRAPTTNLTVRQTNSLLPRFNPKFVKKTK